jgi:hypothetical protein
VLLERGLPFGTLYEETNMNNVSDNSYEKNYSVMLPCEPEQFKEFISGLLGKPQTITQQIRGIFVIAKQDLVNLNYLICQRVEQQNGGTLIQFTTRIVFDDGSSVLLNSLDDLKIYHEIRPVISTQVHLSWVFLLQFKDRTVPEKQVIDVSFTTGGGSTFSYERGEEIIVRGLSFLQSGTAAFRIQHTARTWGFDIQALLTSHLKSILVKESPIRAFIRDHSGKISSIAAGIFFTLAFITAYRAGLNLLTEQINAISKLKGLSVDVASKVDYILTSMSSGIWERYLIASIGYIILALVLSVTLGIFIGTRADTTKPSFILLSPQAELNKTSKLSEYNSKWIELIISMVVGLLTGIVGNYIYAHYIN